MKHRWKIVGENPPHIVLKIFLKECNETYVAKVPELSFEILLNISDNIFSGFCDFRSHFLFPVKRLDSLADATSVWGAS